MKFINWRLAITAIFLFAIACKKPNTDIGLGLQPNPLETFVDNATEIEAKTIKLDTIRTDDGIAGNYLAGNYYDPLLGQFRASIYTQLGLTSVNINESIFEGLVIDSINLVLNYNGYTYGNSTLVHFDVHEVVEAMDDTLMYTDTEYATDRSLAADPYALYKVGNIESNQEVSIPLNETMVEILQNSDATVYNSTTNFIEYFKGIKIGSSAYPSAPGGSVMSFNLASSYIRVFYQSEETTPLVYDFSLSNGTRRFTNIEKEYAVNFDEDTLIDSEYLFIQGGGSLSTKVSLTDLLENHPQGEIFNKAELVVPIETADTDVFGLLLFVGAYVVNEDGEFESIGQGRYEDGVYKFLMTPHIQDVVSRQESNKEIHLLTDDKGFIPIRVTTSRIAILKDEIRLNLTHTE